MACCDAGEGKNNVYDLIGIAVMTVNRKAIWKAKIKDYNYPVATSFVILILWQLAVTLFSVPDYVLPGPLIIIREFFAHLRVLYPHTLVTVYETITGLIIAIFFSVFISVIMVWFRPVEKTLMPLMVFFQTTPKIAIAPLFIVWFGFGYTPKIIIAFWLAYFPIVIATITGLRDIEPEMIDLTSCMSATAWQTFIKVRIPNSLPHFFAGLKLGGIVALLGAIVGEFVGSDAGLGYMITMANHNYDVKLLFSVVIILVILGRLIYAITVWTEKRAISWHVAMRTEEEKFFTA